MKSCVHFENGSHIHGYKDDDEALNQRCGKRRSNSSLRRLYQYNRMKLRKFLWKCAQHSVVHACKIILKAFPLSLKRSKCF